MLEVDKEITCLPLWYLSILPVEELNTSTQKHTVCSTYPLSLFCSQKLNCDRLYLKTSIMVVQISILLILEYVVIMHAPPPFFFKFEQGEHKSPLKEKNNSIFHYDSSYEVG